MAAEVAIVTCKRTTAEKSDLLDASGLPIYHISVRVARRYQHQERKHRGYSGNR